MEINYEPKCNLNESRTNQDNENDYNKIFEMEMTVEEVI